MSQAVLKTVHNYGIKYSDVHVFNSNNVAYMEKVFSDKLLSILALLCIHITCNSHIVTLVESDFKKGFKEVA